MPPETSILKKKTSKKAPPRRAQSTDKRSKIRFVCPKGQVYNILVRGLLKFCQPLCFKTALPYGESLIYIVSQGTKLGGVAVWVGPSVARVVSHH